MKTIRNIKLGRIKRTNWLMRLIKRKLSIWYCFGHLNRFNKYQVRHFVCKFHFFVPIANFYQFYEIQLNFKSYDKAQAANSISFRWDAWSKWSIFFHFNDTQYFEWILKLTIHTWNEGKFDDTFFYLINQMKYCICSLSVFQCNKLEASALSTMNHEPISAHAIRTRFGK